MRVTALRLARPFIAAGVVVPVFAKAVVTGLAYAAIWVLASGARLFVDYGSNHLFTAVTFSQRSVPNPSSWEHPAEVARTGRNPAKAVIPFAPPDGR